MSDIGFDPIAVQNALMREAETLCSALEGRIRQKLSGEVLSSRTGALANSISTSIDDGGTDVCVSASSAGVPYAAIQEFGGKTAAHDILAVKAKALAFVAGGGEMFAKRVRHPGSTIPARSYLASTFADMQDEITAVWKQAVIEALTQN